MAVNIVTGRTGTEHITSDDFRAMNASIFGTGKYVLDYGKKFEPTVVTNNQIRIRDGMCMNQGTQMGIELTDYEDIAIENGVSGSNRNDLIVMRYERNADTSIEKASLVVIKGTAGSTAKDPSYNSGNILDGGELIDDMPLYRVKIESLSITAVEQLFVVFDYSHRKALAGLSNADNTSDLNKPVSKATQKAISDSENKIKQEVADTYATTDDVSNAIDNIEIGGRNLLVGTKDFSGEWTSAYDWSTSSEKYKGFTVKETYIAWNGLYQPIQITKGEVYTFSGYVKKTGGTLHLFAGHGEDFIDKEGLSIECETNEWEYFKITVTAIKTIEAHFRIENNTNNEITYICGLKLENGNKVTPWTPAIEDTESEIQSVDKKVITNLLKPTLATTTRNGVTCTNNGDGTYTIDTGGSAASDNTVFIVSVNKWQIGVKYKFIGCPSGGSTSSYYCQQNYNKNSTQEGVSDEGNGATFTDDGSGGIVNTYIVVMSGTVCDNLVFKPMITTNLNATYDDFVPYTGSTGQLNSDVAEVKAQVGEYTMGAACEKGVSTSVLSGDENLVTGDAVSKAIYTATNYEEGTFTAEIYTSETIGSGTGYYKRIGNIVYIFASIINSTNNNPYGMRGLPFSHLGAIGSSNRSELFYWDANEQKIRRALQVVVGNSVLFDTDVSLTENTIDVWGWYRIV